MRAWSQSARRTEDRCVAGVEEILEGVVPRDPTTARPLGRRPRATHALWLCACITQGDAPIWLIFDLVDGGIAWRRVPVGEDALELVDAHRVAGGHVAPCDVLTWLQGGASDPWWDVGTGDPVVIAELARRIRTP